MVRQRPTGPDSRLVTRYTGMPRVLQLCGAILLMAIASGCGPPADPPGRVLIIGIDGADPHLVDSWRAEGRLPNLDRIAREGASGRIATDPIILSPRIWTTVATGKKPEVHGIESWVHQQGPLKGRTYRSSDRRGHALWNIASDHGLRVGVVNWLMTHPPEKIDGVMISDFNLPDRRRERTELADQFGRDQEWDPGEEHVSATTWPPEWESRARALAAQPPETKLGDAGAPWRDGIWFEALARQLQYADDLVARMGLDIEKTQSPDLLMVLFQGIDRLSHYAWAGVDSAAVYPEEYRPRADERGQMRVLMLDYYTFSDALIGRLLERYGPDDLVIVLSDHGFEPLSREKGLTGGHDSAAAAHGVVYMRGTGIAPGARIEGMSVQDVTPAVLAWIGLGVAEDMSGAVPEFLEVEAKPRVPPYRGEIERVEAPAQKGEQELLEELRGLGYIQ